MFDRIRLALLVRKARKQEIHMNALKSKTVWLGLLVGAGATGGGIIGLVQAFLETGDFSVQALSQLWVGIAIIVLRIVTTKPLADK